MINEQSYALLIIQDYSSRAARGFLCLDTLNRGLF